MPSDDQMIQITQVGNVDAAFVSIDFPQPLMGPAPFTPIATVTNLGDLDFSVLQVMVYSQFMHLYNTQQVVLV